VALVSRGRVVFVAAAVMLAVALLVLRGGDTDPPSASEEPVAGEKLASIAPPGLSGQPPFGGTSPPGDPGELLSRLEFSLTNEELISIPGDVVIEEIDLDRPRVCAGEPAKMVGRVAGEDLGGAAYRWVWPTGGEPSIGAGRALTWQAPAEAGRYRIAFQVVQDLGDRRVGLLAQRVVDIEVVACEEGEGQEHEPLRLVVERLGGTTFGFRALAEPGVAPSRYEWSFGDGEEKTTTAAEVEHAYSIDDLGVYEAKEHVVAVKAVAADGTALRARSLVIVRGVPRASPEEVPVMTERSAGPILDEAEGRWTHEVTVRARGDQQVEWERAERVTHTTDGQMHVDELDWRELVDVTRELEGGGFVGASSVVVADIGPDVERITDRLFGQTAKGEPVHVAWAVYRRD
jgi:hypothetical protein